MYEQIKISLNRKIKVPKVKNFWDEFGIYGE